MPAGSLFPTKLNRSQVLPGAEQYSAATPSSLLLEPGKDRSGQGWVTGMNRSHQLNTSSVPFRATCSWTPSLVFNSALHGIS